MRFDRSLDLLAEHGYEPRQVDRTVLLTNCPFHSLARRHTELVCHMNEALLAGFAESIAPDLLEVRLEPGRGPVLRDPHRDRLTLMGPIS